MVDLFLTEHSAALVDAPAAAHTVVVASAVVGTVAAGTVSVAADTAADTEAPAAAHTVAVASAVVDTVAADTASVAAGTAAGGHVYSSVAHTCSADRSHRLLVFEVL